MYGQVFLDSPLQPSLTVALGFLKMVFDFHEVIAHH